MLVQNVREVKLWKKKPVCWFSVVMAMLLCLCIIRIVIPCREYHYNGSETFDSTISGQAVVYQDISLSPGIWRIELDYSVDTDLQFLCNVADGTVFSGGLLSGGEPLYSGLEKTGYDIRLYESTDSLQVWVSCAGTGSLTTGNLRIVETNQLWTMLLAVLLFITILGYTIFAFYYYDRKFLVPAQKKQVFLFVTTIGFIASVPYLCGYNILGADLIYHLHRIEGVKDGLLSGQFPVRLEPEWLYGYGYANSVFYCNTFLVIPALLRLLGFTVTASYNIYCIVLNFATAWISYYCFYRIFDRRNIGIISSALYTLSVFRIYKLLGTSAVGEGSAVTFMPLVIYGLYRIFTEDSRQRKYKTAWIPVMLGYAGLIQTHVLTCEITALVTILFCVFNIRKVFRKNTFLELAKGAIGAILVSLWFLVPFLDYYMTQDVHIKHVSARTIQDRGLYFAHLAFHFWRTGKNTPMGDNGMQYSHPVGAGLVLLVGLGIFLILWFSGKLQKPAAVWVSFAKKTAVICVLLLFMSTSLFPWDRIQSMNSVFAALVSSIQFPNRFLGWGTVGMVFIFGCCLSYCGNGEKRYYWLVAAAALIGITTSSMFLLDHVNANQEYYQLYNAEGMGVGYISGAEYLIEGTDSEILTYMGPKAGSGVEIDDYEKDSLEINLQCRNQGEDSYVDVPLLLYKGYRAVNPDSGEQMEVCAGENNVVRVLIPAGFEGRINICFVSPLYWRVSELISGVTIVLLLALRWRYRRGGYVRKEV